MTVEHTVLDRMRRVSVDAYIYKQVEQVSCILLPQQPSFEPRKPPLTHFTKSYHFKRMQDPNIPWTVEDHLRCAEEIYYQEDAIHNLIDQIHKKKCVPAKRGKKEYKFRAKEDEKFYKTHLFFKKNFIHSFDMFPSKFQCYMEDVLFQENPEDATIRVYYGHKEEVRTRMRFRVPVLSDCPTMTNSDRRMVHSVNMEYIHCMKVCLDKMKAVNHTCRGTAKDMENWYRHVCKIVDSFDASA